MLRREQIGGLAGPGTLGKNGVETRRAKWGKGVLWESYSWEGANVLGAQSIVKVRIRL